MQTATHTSQTSQKIPKSRVPQSTLALIQTAKNSGVPKDSLERFLLAGYVPQPKQLELHGLSRLADTVDEIEDIAYGGARGGGKTHGGFGQIASDHGQKLDGLPVLVLRRKAAPAERVMQ